MRAAIASFEPSEQRPKKKKKKKHSIGGADPETGLADAVAQQRQQKTILFSLLSASFSAQQMRHLPLEDMGMTFFLALEHESATVGAGLDFAWMESWIISYQTSTPTPTPSSPLT